MMLSEKIKFLRQSEGLSQEKLASKLEVTRQTVVNWEKGTTPTPYLLNQIAILFHVELNSLIEDDTELIFLPGVEEQLDIIKEEMSVTCKKTCLCSKLIIFLLLAVFSFIMLSFNLRFSKEFQLDASFDIYFWTSLGCVFLVFALIAFLERMTYRLIFFKDKYIIREGVFQKRFSECKFDAYKNINIKQSIWGEVLNYGDICIDGLPQRLYFKGIKSPHKLREFIVLLYK